MAPSLEELCIALQTDNYLVSVLALCQRHSAVGYGGVDCIDRLVAGDEDDDEGPLTDAVREQSDFVDRLSASEKLSAVPFLRRLGYSVMVWVEEDRTLSFSVFFPGKSFPLNRERRSLARGDCVYHRSTSLGAQRLRGVMWCLPRVMRWKNRTLERAYAPGGTMYLRTQHSFMLDLQSLV